MASLARHFLYILYIYRFSLRPHEKCELLINIMIIYLLFLSLKGQILLLLSEKHKEND